MIQYVISQKKLPITKSDVGDYLEQWNQYQNS